MKNINRIVGGVAMVVLTGFLGSHALAGSLKLNLGPAGTQAGIGGEFNVSEVTGGSPGGTAVGAEANYVAGVTAFGASFETFCIEHTETFSPGGTYNYDINTKAIKGGMATGDEITKGTAYLYSRFAQGTLPGYNYTPGASRISTAGSLQNAIWYLEGEISLSAGDISGNIFLSGAAGAITFYGSEAAAKADALGLYGVYALNLGPADLFPNQDQLIYRGGGFSTPDAGSTVLFLGMAMTGLVGAHRRFRKI